MIIRTFYILIVSCFLSITAYGASSEPEKKEAPEDVSEYVMIPPISVAMYNRRKRPAGTMTVIMQLKIDDSEQRTEARKVLPRLTNAYMNQTLKLARDFFDINRPINANILSRALQSSTNMVLKHDKARVLIGDIAVQKR